VGEFQIKDATLLKVNDVMTQQFSRKLDCNPTFKVIGIKQGHIKLERLIPYSGTHRRVIYEWWNLHRLTCQYWQAIHRPTPEGLVQVWPEVEG
jgi:hypothetical protein